MREKRKKSTAPCGGEARNGTRWRYCAALLLLGGEGPVASGGVGVGGGGLYLFIPPAMCESVIVFGLYRIDCDNVKNFVRNI